MRLATCTFLLLSAVACTAERGFGPQTAPTTPPVRVSADNSVSAPRAVLWIVNGRVLGRAIDPRSLLPDSEPLDPRLIEGIEVVKGQAAVKVFGLAAAEGAVVVTTRQVIPERRD